MTAPGRPTDEIYRMIRQAIIDKDIVKLPDVSINKSTGEWHTASTYSPVQTSVDEVDVKVEIGKGL